MLRPLWVPPKCGHVQQMVLIYRFKLYQWQPTTCPYTQVVFIYRCSIMEDTSIGTITVVFINRYTQQSIDHVYLYLYLVGFQTSRC